MTRRDSWVPPVLTLVTCGFYYLYWQYVTSEELKQATGRDDINPLMDLLITVACCGFWAIYVQYRNAQVVHQSFQAAGQQHEDKSSFILIMHLLNMISGVTAFVAMMVLQDELNKLGELQTSGGFGGGPPVTF
jgi:heme/copper-type cytochrome/quinol oxidase subunit 3